MAKAAATDCLAGVAAAAEWGGAGLTLAFTDVLAGAAVAGFVAGDTGFFGVEAGATTAALTGAMAAALGTGFTAAGFTAAGFTATDFASGGCTPAAFPATAFPATALPATSLSWPARESWAALAEAFDRSDTPDAFMPNSVCLT